MKVIKTLVFSNKRSVRFYKYFFSYVIIVVTLLTSIGSVVYSHFFRALKSEVESANIAALMQIRETIDMRFKEMQRIAVHISKNPQRWEPSLHCMASGKI